jgi:flagellar biosynthesis protein FlhB
MADGSEKTEQPTQKRLKEARDRGQVPRSRDLALAISSIALTLALGSYGPGIAATMAERLATGLRRIGDRPLDPISPGELAQAVVSDGLMVFRTVGPLLGLAALVGVLGTVAQSGFVLSAEPLKLKWDKLSPSAGLARLKPSQGGVEFLKSLIVVSALSTIAFKIINAQMLDGGMVARMAPADAAAYAWDSIRRLLWQGALAMLVIGAADFLVQRWRMTSGMKMSKQEVKDEARSSEGSPELKARIRQIQREMTKRRMLKSVPTATVVVTNPTHYAVALHYDRTSMVAPIVVAKGIDHMAQKIKEIARQHGVPTVENVPLAQALYKGAEIGDTIPGPLFGAVAELLAYLVRLKQIVL